MTEQTQLGRREGRVSETHSKSQANWFLTKHSSQPAWRDGNLWAMAASV